MTPRRFATHVAASALVFATGTTFAQEPLELGGHTDLFGEWSLSGSVSGTVEFFAVDGDRSASPFFETGTQPFIDFDLQFNRRFSPFNMVEGTFFGTLNDSAFRSDLDGFIPERGDITWTNGETAVPYRATVGDFFGFFSPLTVDTSLKGALVDVQPNGTVFGAAQSLLGFAGTRLQTYRDLDEFDDEQHAGASFLLDWEDAALSFNFTTGRLGSDLSLDAEPEVRSVASIAGFKEFVLSDRHRIDLDAELGYALGDTIDEAVETSGFGGTLELRGSYDQHFYRAFFERYEAAFAPIAGSIESDRQTVELEVGTRFENGLSVRARGQDIREGFTLGPLVTSQTVGLNLSGGVADAFGLRGLNGALDTFVTQSERADGTRETRDFVTTMNVNAGLTESLSANAGFLYDRGDDLLGDFDTATRQATLGLSKRFAVWDLDGSVTTGLVLRDTRLNGARNFDFGPNGNLSLSNDSHQFQLSGNLLSQRPDIAGGEVDSSNVAARYSYRMGPHVFDLEASFIGRSPEIDPETNAFKFGATYTLNFEKTPESQLRANQPEPDRSRLEERLAQARDDRLDLADLPLGAPLEESFALLEAQGIIGAVPVGRALIFEQRAYPNIFNRQRLFVLPGTDGMLKTAGVIIDTEVARGADGLVKLLDDVRRELIRLYGRPFVFEEGTFNRSGFEQIATGQVIRISEWQVNGGVIRLGFPQRLDGQVRLEVQFRERFPPPSRTDWSVEEIF